MAREAADPPGVGKEYPAPHQDRFDHSTVGQGDLCMGREPASFTGDLSTAFEVAAVGKLAIWIDAGNHPRTAFPAIILQGFQTGVGIG